MKTYTVPQLKEPDSQPIEIQDISENKIPINLVDEQSLVKEEVVTSEESNS